MNALIKRLARIWIVVAAFGLLSGCITPRWDWPPWEVNPAPEQPQPEDPDPDPDPEPQPPPPPPDTDIGLPVGTQWIYGRNIAGWPETINLSEVEVLYAANIVRVTYDRLQQIPAWNFPGDPNNVTNVNGCIWLVREFRGQWYIGTFEYIRVGQTHREFHWRGVEKYLFDPKPGDRVGFMISTMARNAAKEDGTYVHGDPSSPYRERSNIMWLPGDWNPPR